MRLPAGRRAVLEAVLVADRAAFEAVAAAAPGAVIEPVADGLVLWFWEGAPLNRVVGIGPGGLGADGIDRAIAFYARRSAPARVELSPLVPAADLAALASRGFTLESQLNRFARPLDEPPPWPSDVEIEPDGERWARLAAIGFEDLPGPDPEVDTGRFTYRILRLMHEMPDTVGLVAQVDGRPAATGRVQISGDVAFLTGQATRAEARGRGGQQRILAASLAWAKARGAALAVVEAVPLGVSERNILRAGFELLFTAAVLKRPGGKRPEG